MSIQIGPEMMPPKIDQTATLAADGITVDGGTMKEPGFLRCIVTIEQNGRTYRGLATAAFNPEAIKPTQQDPADFDQFWAAGKAALAKIPIDAKVTPLPEYGNAAADCYHVNLQNVGMGNAPSRFYGVMCEPKAPGKYPALSASPAPVFVHIVVLPRWPRAASSHCKSEFTESRSLWISPSTTRLAPAHSRTTTRSDSTTATAIITAACILDASAQTTF